MKRLRLALFVAAVSTTSAFAAPAGAPRPVASDPAPQADAAAPGADKSDVKCIRERMTGSNRIVKRCLPAERMKQLTQDEKMDMIRSPRGTAVLDD